MPSLKPLALLALTTGIATLTAAQTVSGTGTTTRYWDCCKGSCAWPGKASVSNPITTCSKSDAPSSEYNTASACDGGDAYMCSDQSPWAVSDTLAYGFAAAHIPGGSESSWCCACYELTFTSTAIAGKKMIVQATNTGADLGDGQFDLAIPGGGVGLFNACTDEWGAPANGWGAQYGGIASNTCSSFPSALQSGCGFRFGSFFEGADNPAVTYKQVTCPKVLTDKTGCIRDGETPTTNGDTSGVSTVAAVASSTAVTSSSTAAMSSAAPAPIISSSSTVVVAPVASSSSPAVVAPIASSSSTAVVAPVISSSSAAAVAPIATPSSTAVVAPVTSSSSTAESSSSTAVIPTVPTTAAIPSPPYPISLNATLPAGTGTGTAATSGVVPSGGAPVGEKCEVQYVYEHV